MWAILFNTLCIYMDFILDKNRAKYFEQSLWSNQMFSGVGANSSSSGEKCYNALLHLRGLKHKADM